MGTLKKGQAIQMVLYRATEAITILSAPSRKIIKRLDDPVSLAQRDFRNVRARTTPRP